MKKRLLSLMLMVITVTLPTTLLAQATAGDETNAEPYAVLSENNTVLTFYYDDQKTTRNGLEVGPFNGDGIQTWYWQRESIINAVFDSSFANCTSITSTAHWFNGCKNMSSVSGIQYLKTDNVTDMKDMFSYCRSLPSIDVSGFNTSNVMTMSGMFALCESLTSLDVSGFKTDKVINMSSMFNSCKSLTTLDVSGFNTANVTDMAGMFFSCTSLTDLNLSNFNTANVTTMNSMFHYCIGLTNLDVSNFNTEKVTSMASMFWNCHSLTSLNISSFVTPYVTNVEDMFSECSSLTTILVGKGWSTGQISNGESMFAGCVNLVGEAGTTFDESHIDFTYAHIDGGISNPGYFSGNGVPYAEPYAALSNQNTVLTFYYDDQKKARQGMSIGPFSSDYIYNSGYIGWEQQRDSITSVVFDDSFSNYTDLISTVGWFFNCSKLETVSGLQNIHLGKLEDMSYMFYHCSALKSLDLSYFSEANLTKIEYMLTGCSGLTDLNLGGFNTANITDMNSMFSGCSGLTSLDLSSLNTENVTSMSSMFSGCSGLTSLDLSNFKTEHVTSMAAMFNNCSHLTSLDLSNFNTENVTTMYYMFNGCSRLKSLNMSGLDMTSLNDILYMFSGCSYLESIDLSNSVLPNLYRFFYGLSSLKELNLSNCNTSKMTTMKEMFSGCSKLITLDLSSFNTTNVTDMYCMFYDCPDLVSIDLSSFNTVNVTSMKSMFSACPNLMSIDVSGFNTESVTDMSSMFLSCPGLTSLDVTNFNTANVTNISHMFGSCTGLTSLDLRNFNTGNVTDMGYMFSGCTSLNTIYAGEGWSTAKVSSSSYMFHQCTSLVGGAGTVFDSSHTDHTYAHIDEGPSNPGYFTDKNAPVVVAAPTFRFEGDSLFIETATKDASIFYQMADLPNMDEATVQKISESLTVTADAQQSIYYEQPIELKKSVVLKAIAAGATNSEVSTLVYDYDAWQKLLEALGYGMDVSGRASDNSNVPDEMKEQLSHMLEEGKWVYYERMWESQAVYSLTNEIMQLAHQIDEMMTVVTEPEPYAVLSDNNTVLTLYYDSQKGNRQGAMAMNPDGTNVPWGEYAESIINVTIDPSFVDFHAWTMANWFSDFTSLTTINGIEYLNTEGTTSLRALFQRCTSLESIDVSHFKTESVEDMAAMFNECNSLRSIDCSNFNTSNVLWTYGMFGNCAQLETINVSGFENVGECSNMFSHCPNLRTIYSDRDWDITLQINRETVFEDCNSLIGGNGTSYSATHGDCTYARLDREGVPGYFTQNDSEPYEPQKGVVVNLINNGDLEGEESSNFFYRNMQKSLDVISVGITDGVGVNDSRGLKVEATAKQDNVYDNEFLFQLNQPVSEGTKIKLTFDYRAEKAAKIYMAAHGDYFGDFIWDWPNPYIYADTEWQSYTFEGVVTSSISTDQKPLGRVDFSLNEYPDANIYYFDNVKFEVYVEDQCPKPTFTKTDSKVKIQSPFDAKIYYTLDGSTPTENSTLYTDALTLSENATIKAIAVVDGYEVSDVATYLFEAPTPQGDDSIIQFADANVKAICVNNWDTDGDGELSKAEAANVISLDNAFTGNKDITSFDEFQYFVGVIALGSREFGGCYNLSSIILPPNLKSLEAESLNGNKIDELTIPASVTSIEPSALYATYKNIFVEEGNAYFSSIDGVLFNKDITKIVTYPERKAAESYEIPNTVVTIGRCAFYSSELKSVTIPYGVNTIEGSAFRYCGNLESIDIPGSVETIGYDNFEFANSLTTATIPSSVKSIDTGVFASCQNLQEIIVDTNNQYYTSVDGVLYTKDKTHLVTYPAGKPDENVVIPNYVTSIGQCGVYGCNNIKSVVIPRRVESIGWFAFVNCANLNSVTTHRKKPLELTKTFDDRAQQNGTLYVPYGTKELYQAADEWNGFQNIVELDPSAIISLVNNGDMEGEDNGNFFVRTNYSSGNEEPVQAAISNGVGVNGSRGIKVEATSKLAVSWDNQFWVRLNQPISEGTLYRVSFDYRADKEAMIGAEAHEEPTAYINWGFFGNDLSFTDSWSHFEFEGTMSSLNSKDELPFQSLTFSFNNNFENANNYYFDNFNFEVMMENQCPKPTFKQKGNEISILSPFNAKIYYTLDGSTPTTSSQVYAGSLKLTENAEINAIAVVEGYEASPVATCKFVHPQFDSNGVLAVTGRTRLSDALEAVGGREEVAKTITAILWEGNYAVYNRELQSLDNPNMLIYVNDAALAPANRDNVVIGGLAKNIVLTDVESGNNNFYCPQEFTAEMISYTHEYRQQTEIGVARGWETIALPFTVQTIMHEKWGGIVPFGNSNSGANFWLRQMTSNGLQRATKIEANVPYIISMPNNETYDAPNNLAGRVTFSSQDALVPMTEYTSVHMAVENGMLMFVPCFQTTQAHDMIYALNVGETRGNHPEGSVFEANYRDVRPFEAFTVHEGGNKPAPQFILVFDLNQAGFTGIENVRSHMCDGRSDVWYNLNGRRLQQKPTQKGVYLNNRCKVIIR